jgi:RimJ/RimL family protein N-acetyltransferase
VTSLDDVTWPVTTERLSFRPSTADDAAAFFAYRSRPEVSDWLPRLALEESVVAERFTDEEFRKRTLVVEVDGRVVGDLYLHLGDSWAHAEAGEAPGQAEIGWALDPAYQGRGLAREAVRALLDLCFTGLGLRRVTAICFADNTASWRLMEKLGMRREAHTVKDALHRDRGWLDGYTYALLAEEWPPRA